MHLIMQNNLFSCWFVSFANIHQTFQLRSSLAKHHTVAAHPWLKQASSLDEPRHLGRASSSFISRSDKGYCSRMKYFIPVKACITSGEVWLENLLPTQVSLDGVPDSIVIHVVSPSCVDSSPDELKIEDPLLTHVSFELLLENHSIASSFFSLGSR